MAPNIDAGSGGPRRRRHGQMSETELEKTILDFLDGEYDVVSTSIIETGVDIPNVNTLIVHDADKMGLPAVSARGRVGRSNRIAYAYFTYQRDKVLTEVAEKRRSPLKNLRSLAPDSDCDAGPVDSRRATCSERSDGFIASVGFDLYSQMLAEEIQKRKVSMLGEPPLPSKDWNTSIDLGSTLTCRLITSMTAFRRSKFIKVAVVSSIDESAELEDERLTALSAACGK